MTNSKKLQTTLSCGDLKPASVRAEVYFYEALEHDARVAHEMLPVIKQLERELAHLVNLLHGPFECYGEIEIPGLATLNGARAALNSAAPFLQED